MLYVILIAAIVIFWLIAVDRPVLKVSFDDGHLSKVKGIYLHLLNITYKILANMTHLLVNSKCTTNAPE